MYCTLAESGVAGNYTAKAGFYTIGTDSGIGFRVCVNAVNDNGFFVATDGGMVLDSATGGSQGAGSLNAAADIFKNGVAYTNPKWVLQHFYAGSADSEGPYAAPPEYEGLMSLDVHEELVREKHDLPLMLLKPKGGLFERGDMLLASVEEAYLYIYQLHQRIRMLEDKVAA